MKIFRRRWLLPIVVAFAVTVGGVAYASIPDSAGLIHGCYANSNGALRLVDGVPCKSTEAAVLWNQKGVPGIPGTNGTNGVSGYEAVSRTIDSSTASSSDPGNSLSVAIGCSAGHKAVGGGAIDVVWIDANSGRHIGNLSQSGPLNSGGVFNIWIATITKLDGSNFGDGEKAEATVTIFCMSS